MSALLFLIFNYRSQIYTRFNWHPINLYSHRCRRSIVLFNTVGPVINPFNSFSQNIKDYGIYKTVLYKLKIV